MIEILARFSRAGILMLWGTVLSYFFFSGRIVSYLHPAFHWMTISAGVILVILALLVLLLPAESDSAGCAPTLQSPILLRAIGGVVLVIPLVVTVASSPSQFGATAVMNRGIISSASQLPYIVNIPDEPLPGQAFGADGGSVMDYLTRNAKGQIVTEALDLLYAAEEPSMRQDFEGQEVEMIGQFMPANSNNPNGNRFNLVRMFMLCCAADAQPLAILVQPQDFQIFPDMTWVKVSGKAVFPVEGGNRIALVENAHVEETAAPAEVFVY
ncbi:MAG: TIGR03943 family putative permease subunit [Chthoniobacterales bacterium]